MTGILAPSKVCPPRHYVKCVEAIEIIAARPCDRGPKSLSNQASTDKQNNRITVLPRRNPSDMPKEESSASGTMPPRALLSLWKEATQVLLTQGLLPEIAFWFGRDWEEYEMSLWWTRRLFYALVAHSLLSSFHAFILPPPTFFFLSLPAPFWSTKASFDAFHPRCFNRPRSFSREEDQWSRGEALKTVRKPSKMEIVSCSSLKLWVWWKKEQFLFQCET